MPAADSTLTLAWPLADLTRDQLLGIAVRRGCRHYQSQLPPNTAAVDDPRVPHEVLGAALLRGSPDGPTFQAIRCGAMVLSDLGNSPPRIAEACEQFEVAHRAAHIARLGLLADEYPEFWRAVLDALPPATGEEQFLPGVSRLTSETRLPRPGGQPVRIWLRTHYAR